MSSNYTVNSCICHKRTFEEIKEYAAQQGYTSVQQLKDDNYCSCQCGLCEPYITLMLKTGNTVFDPGAYLEKN